MGWDWVYLVLRPLFGLLYETRMIDDDDDDDVDNDCGEIGGKRIDRGNLSTWRKPAPVPLRPPQISHDLTRARTRAAAMGSLRLPAWAMALSFSPVTLRYILILPSCLCLDFTNSFLPFKVLYTLFIYPMRATRPAHLILLDLRTLKIFGEAYMLVMTCLLSIFLQSPASSTLRVPNFSSAPRFGHLELCSSFNVSRA
jgi:hypothetical protein